MNWAQGRRCALTGLGAALAVAVLMGGAHAAIHTELVEYKDGETVLEGYLAYDDSVEEQRPGVLIVHEWWGLGEHQKMRARMLAELGYVAFALDMYGKGKLTDDAQTAGTWAGVFRNDPEMAKRRFETGAVKMYNASANACAAEKDQVSKQLFEELLAEEEEHLGVFQNIKKHVDKPVSYTHLTLPTN